MEQLDLFPTHPEDGVVERHSVVLSIYRNELTRRWDISLVIGNYTDEFNARAEAFFVAEILAREFNAKLRPPSPSTETRQ